TLWTALLKHNKVSSITVFNFLIPVVGTLLSALVLGESILRLQYLIALPVVVLGIVLVTYSSSKEPV
ncbi:MAG: EamA/RhaT family transporter, partial [Spirochaetales bacterium]|nr:EamA/RhaT family transporter [Spirochaetales bacterium]